MSGEKSANSTVTNEEVYIPKEISNWEELDANQNLLRGIYGYGFEKPSPIQKKSDMAYIRR